VTLKSDIETRVRSIFKDQWTTRNGTVVPDTDDIALGNDAVLLDGTVLYADLAGSTDMVDRYRRAFAAEIYKAFLYATARVIRAEGGEIVAYDGDRVMAIFLGDSKNTCAVRCGLKINWTVGSVVMPLLKKQYPDSTFKIRHVVGIDTSDLWVARTGIRGANDLVWVGPAANYAAKLTELDANYPTWITHRVYDKMSKDAKYATDGSRMWEQRSWTPMGGLTVYRSSYWWKYD
jgi:class 3 adenylate cyclase